MSMRNKIMTTNQKLEEIKALLGKSLKDVQEGVFEIVDQSTPIPIDEVTSLLKGAAIAEKGLKKGIEKIEKQLKKQ